MVNLDDLLKTDEVGDLYAIYPAYDEEVAKALKRMVVDAFSRGQKEVRLADLAGKFVSNTFKIFEFQGGPRFVAPVDVSTGQISIRPRLYTSPLNNGLPVVQVMDGTFILKTGADYFQKIATASAWDPFIATGIDSRHSNFEDLDREMGSARNAHFAIRREFYGNNFGYEFSARRSVDVSRGGEPLTLTIDYTLTFRPGVQKPASIRVEMARHCESSVLRGFICEYRLDESGSEYDFNVRNLGQAYIGLACDGSGMRNAVRSIGDHEVLARVFDGFYWSANYKLVGLARDATVLPKNS